MHPVSAIESYILHIQKILQTKLKEINKNNELIFKTRNQIRRFIKDNKDIMKERNLEYIN